MVVSKCPSEILLGCCFIVGKLGLGDFSYCFYVGAQSSLDQATCEEVGTWSKTSPP